MTTRTTLTLTLTLVALAAIFLPPRIRITTNIPKTAICMVN